MALKSKNPSIQLRGGGRSPWGNDWFKLNPRWLQMNPQQDYPQGGEGSPFRGGIKDNVTRKGVNTEYNEELLEKFKNSFLGKALGNYFGFPRKSQNRTAPIEDKIYSAEPDALGQADLINEAVLNSAANEASKNEFLQQQNALENEFGEGSGATVSGYRDYVNKNPQIPSPSPMSSKGGRLNRPSLGESSEYAQYLANNPSPDSNPILDDYNRQTAQLSDSNYINAMTDLREENRNWMNNYEPTPPPVKVKDVDANAPDVDFRMTRKSNDPVDYDAISRDPGAEYGSFADELPRSWVEAGPSVFSDAEFRNAGPSDIYTPPEPSAWDTDFSGNPSEHFYGPSYPDPGESMPMQESKGNPFLKAATSEASNVSPEDMRVLQTLYGEGRGESKKGQQAILETILNRLGKVQKTYPDSTVEDIVNKRKQFSVWNPEYRNSSNTQTALSLTPDSKWVQDILPLYRGLQGGSIDRILPEDTYHYFNPEVVSPVWYGDDMNNQTIGRHKFVSGQNFPMKGS